MSECTLLTLTFPVVTLQLTTTHTDGHILVLHHSRTPDLHKLRSHSLPTLFALILDQWTEYRHLLEPDQESIHHRLLEGPLSMSLPGGQCGIADTHILPTRPRTSLLRRVLPSIITTTSHTVHRLLRDTVHMRNDLRK